jgi:uncharacterized membrane protein YoaK (UPF0700 family)
MLTVLFFLSGIVICASIVRRPQKLWERAAVLLAVIIFLAVCVAWGISYVLQNS